MTCRDYLSQHSEFLDERLDAQVAAQFRAHAAECPRCARYDRVVRRSLRMVRELPDVAPSSDFHQRLQHRIFHVQEELAHERFAASGAAAALAIAAVIAFAAWSPLLRPAVQTGEGLAVETPVAAVESTAPALATEPMQTPAWWYATGAPTVFTHAATSGYPVMSAMRDPALAFPGPYSPLIVSPPRRFSGHAAILARYAE